MRKSKNSKSWSLIKRLNSESQLIKVLQAEEAAGIANGQNAALISSLTRSYDQHLQQLLCLARAARSGV